MRNVKLGRQVLDHVVANPREFNMDTFGMRVHPCWTVACLAGRTLLLSGWTLGQDGPFRDPDGNCVFGSDVSRAAVHLMGLTDEEYRGPGYRASLFSGSQTNSEAIERFRVIVEKAEAAA